MKFPVIMRKELPFEASLFVKRDPDNRLHISFEDEWKIAGIGWYDESGPLWSNAGWVFQADHDPNMEPWENLLHSTLREAFMADLDERKRKTKEFEAHPFWKDFIEEVERLYPVSDVMMG